MNPLMHLRFSFIIILLLTCGAAAQTGLNVQGEIIELLSAEKDSLHGQLSSPRFSPNSQQIFSFVRQLEDNRNLYIYNTARQELRQVIIAQASELNISGPPFGRMIQFSDQLDWRPVYDKQGTQWFAFVHNGDMDNHDIYLGAIDQAGLIRLTFDAAIDNSPKWSPDGKEIAFLSSRSGSGDIYLLSNLDRVIESGSAEHIEIRQLTSTEQEEVDLDWNPNPEAHLLAYSRRVAFSVPKGESFQVRILNLASRNLESTPVSNNPMSHYTRPQWDRYDDSQLIYIGQPIDEGSAANVYAAECRWEESRLFCVPIEGKGQALFKNVRLEGSTAVWLSGSAGILCQQNNVDQQHPLFSVNLERWRSQLGETTHYIEDLHEKCPLVTGFDIKGNILLLTSQIGTDFKVFALKFGGDNVAELMPVKRKMKNPSASSPFYKNRLVQLGGAGTIGALIFLISSPGVDGGNGPGTVIGKPPVMPDPGN